MSGRLFTNSELSIVDEKFGSERRLKKRIDYIRIQEGGARSRGRHLIWICRKLVDTSEQSRLGITISKKAEKLAVKRNRFKRRIREIFRRMRGRFIKSGDIVIIALAGASELDYSQLANEMVFLAGKAGFIVHSGGPKPRSISEKDAS